MRPGTERQPWLISYADMLMLLLCFFVVLFSASDLREKKFRAAVGSLRAQLGFLPASTGFMPREPGGAGRTMRKHDKLGVAGKEKSVRSLEVGKRISVDAAVEFAEGSVELTGPARETIAAAADKLLGLKNRIEVRGHASEAEVARGLDGWKLGWERARAVADELVRRDISEKRLRLASCSSQEQRREPRAEILVVREFVGGE